MARREKMTAGERIACEFASGGDWGPSQRRDIARRIDTAIRKAANSAAWDGYGYACNGVFPEGMEVMFGKSAAKRPSKPKPCKHEWQQSTPGPEKPEVTCKHCGIDRPKGRSKK